METSPTEAHVSFSKRITSETSEGLLADVEWCGSHGFERVELAMSTRGGEVACAMNAFKGLRDSSLEVVTRATGEVASMGVVLFLAGERRLATPEATFLLHPVRLVLPGCSVEVDAKALRRMRARFQRSSSCPTGRLEELDHATARVEREDDAVQAILEERTSLTRGPITKLVYREAPVDVSYALAAGIVHELVSPVV